MSNELLVIRCQLGERGAFADLVRAWHEPLTAFVRRMIASTDVDDITQEIWLAVVRGLPGLRDASRFPPWLFTVARRAVVNRLRAEYRRPETPHDGWVEKSGPDEFAIAGDRVDLADALLAVPVREREALVLHYLHDLSLRDCAQVCEVPVGTIKSRLSRGRYALRAELIRKGHRP